MTVSRETDDFGQPGEPVLPPTGPQLDLAHRLGIVDPHTLNRRELSVVIDLELWEIRERDMDDEDDWLAGDYY